MGTDNVIAFDQWCPDGTCYTRVSSEGPTLGIQLEESIKHLTGPQVAERIVACNDVAYLRGRLELRAEFEKDPTQHSLDGLETQADLNAAIRNLKRFEPQ